MEESMSLSLDTFGLSVLADNLCFRGLNDIIQKTDKVLLQTLVLYYNSNAP
jgi:hypothetical protein